MIYIHRSDGAYGQYQGMSLGTVTSLLAGLGLTGTQITKEQYEAGLADLN